MYMCVCVHIHGYVYVYVRVVCGACVCVCVYPHILKAGMAAEDVVSGVFDEHAVHRQDIEADLNKHVLRETRNKP